MNTENLYTINNTNRANTGNYVVMNRVFGAKEGLDNMYKTTPMGSHDFIEQTGILGGLETITYKAGGIFDRIKNKKKKEEKRRQDRGSGNSNSNDGGLLDITNPASPLNPIWDDIGSGGSSGGCGGDYSGGGDFGGGCDGF